MKYIFGVVASLGVLSVSPASLLGSQVGKGSIRVKEGRKQDYVKLAKLTLEQAIQKALSEVSGQAVEAELQEEDGSLTYSVKVVSSDEKLIKLEIDAGNGSVLQKRYEGSSH